MIRKTHPDFHKALMDQATYPVAPRHIRYQETRCSHLYRTGAEVFKLRKASSIYSSLAVKEVLNSLIAKMEAAGWPESDVNEARRTLALLEGAE